MKNVENIVAKGGIACFEQFLLLSQCFQKSSAADASESVYMWERVKSFYDILANSAEPDYADLDQNGLKVP